LSEKGIVCLKSQICSGRIAQPQQRGGKILGERQSERVFEVNAAHRGVLKQALLAAGYPAEDLAGYVAGDAGLTVALNCQSGAPFLLDYQKEAAAVFYQ